MKRLENLANEFLDAKKNIELARRLVASNEEKAEKIKEKVFVEMAKHEKKSYRFDEHTIRVTGVKYVKVLDEKVLIEELKRNEIQGLTKVKVDTVKFKKYAIDMYRDENQLLEGTDLVETKYLSVK